MVALAMNIELALLLALQNLEIPLSSAEKAALKKAGQKLAMHPQRRSLILQELMPAFEANEAFQHRYHTAKNQLDTLEKIPSDLLPTEAELHQELPVEEERERWGKKPTSTGNSQNTELINVIVPDILKQPELAKNLSFLARISNFLNNPSQG
jgi:hypothetical protein